MAKTVPTAPPTRATAGDTWKFTRVHGTYPVSEGWALSYDVRGVKRLTWKTAWVANDGSTHTVTIPKASTAKLVAGTYELTEVWTGSGDYDGERYTEALAPLVVTADPTEAAAGDREAFAEKMLGYCEAAIAARLKGDTPVKYAIGGRSAERMTMPELERARAKYQAELYRIRNPGTGHRSVAVRFGRPTR